VVWIVTQSTIGAGLLWRDDAGLVRFSGNLVEEDAPELVSTDSAVVVYWRMICAGSEDLSNDALEGGL